MTTLKLVLKSDLEQAMEIVNQAKQHLKEQGVDQWQSGYPDRACIEQDIQTGKGYFLVDGSDIFGYLCIDFDGEPAYSTLNGTWEGSEQYAVVHRLALTENSRGKGISSIAFGLVEVLCKEKHINTIRVDTDAGNEKMQHILKKNGFTYRGTILFDNSEKIAFEKLI